eukprot:CAMPEP_0176258780 /NCGR_PEP_ID=MMETSP0121_2-20121125/38736_1 /TAXON_ID=160619 /ORGANISM="Kryptoperidinium foliaceum, Strain CCMP 1326" /LENGTH=308 /DNA_ID=CAMNT_0017598655 /DNA_START=29 /DNA_END=952 /DNA_ORIENTATION=-
MSLSKVGGKGGGRAPTPFIDAWAWVAPHAGRSRLLGMRPASAGQACRLQRYVVLSMAVIASLPTKSKPNAPAGAREEHLAEEPAQGPLGAVAPGRHEDDAAAHHDERRSLRSPLDVVERRKHDELKVRRRGQPVQEAIPHLRERLASHATVAVEGHHAETLRRAHLQLRAPQFRRPGRRHGRCVQVALPLEPTDAALHRRRGGEVELAGVRGRQPRPEKGLDDVHVRSVRGVELQARLTQRLAVLAERRALWQDHRRNLPLAQHPADRSPKLVALHAAVRPLARHDQLRKPAEGEDVHVHRPVGAALL